MSGVMCRAKPRHTYDDLNAAAELLQQAADLTIHSPPTVNDTLHHHNQSAGSPNTTDAHQQHASPSGSRSPRAEANVSHESAWWTAEGLELGNASHAEALFLLGTVYDAGRQLLVLKHGCIMVAQVQVSVCAGCLRYAVERMPHDSSLQ